MAGDCGWEAGATGRTSTGATCRTPRVRLESKGCPKPHCDVVHSLRGGCLGMSRRPSARREEGGAAERKTRGRVPGQVLRTRIPTRVCQCPGRRSPGPAARRRPRCRRIIVPPPAASRRKRERRGLPPAAGRPGHRGRPSVAGAGPTAARRPPGQGGLQPAHQPERHGASLGLSPPGSHRRAMAGPQPQGAARAPIAKYHKTLESQWRSVEPKSRLIAQLACKQA